MCHNYKRDQSMLCGLVPFIVVYDGWGAGIRTPIGRSRVGSPTVERHPKVISGKYNTLTLAHCQAMFVPSRQLEIRIRWEHLGKRTCAQQAGDSPEQESQAG